MQFREFTESWIQELRFKKQHEILQKIKKPIYNNSEKLSSDEPARTISDLKIIEDGSLRMYLSNAEQPVRYYPDAMTVNIVAIYKRLAVLLIKSLEKQNWLQRFITVLAIKFNFNNFIEWFDVIYNNNYVLLKEEHWSQPVKEIRRVLKGKLDQRLVDAIALIFEYDSAYRYRFQDVIVELKTFDYDGVLHLFDILAERDYDQMQEKWKRIKKFVGLLFIISPKIKYEIINILQQLNIDEVKMSVEDIYWTNQFLNVYKYRGQSVVK